MLFTIAIPLFALAYIEPQQTLYYSVVEVYNSGVWENPSDEASTVPHIFFLEEKPVYEPPSSTSTGFSVECFCVTWLREVKGYNVKGDADTISPNVEQPFAMGVVLLDYDGVRHVAGIKHVLIDRLLIEESNFEKCTPTERVIMMDDPHIVGYFYKNPNVEKERAD